MSEGQLKQRIEALNEQTLEETILSGRLTLARCDLDMILDEAKADFPRVIFPDDAGPEYFQTAKEELAAIQKWYLKWLGAP